MRTTLYIGTLAALALPGAALAQDGGVPSKHYPAVAEHLQEGGEAYTYVELDGDTARVGKFVDDLMATISKVRGEPIRGIGGLSFADLVADLGVENLAAYGSSTKRDGDHFHTRSFLYLPGGREGVMRVGGGPAKTFNAASMAPAGTDMVIEQEIDLAELLPVVDKVVRRVGNPDLSANWASVNTQMIEPLQMTVGQLLSKLHTRVTVIGRIHPDEPLELAGAPFDIPSFEVFVSIDNLAWLIPKLVEQAPGQVRGMMERGVGFMRIEGPPVPPEAPIMRPVVNYNVLNGRLSFATSVEFLELCNSRKGGLFESDAYRKVTAGLPEEGNSLAYFSERFGAEAERLYTEILRGQGEIPEGALGAMMGFVEDTFPMVGGAFASVGANLDNGLLQVTNSNTASGSMGAVSVGVVAIAAAVSVPVFTRIQENAFGAQELNQLRQCGLALRVYASDNDGRYPDRVDDKELVEEFGGEELFRFADRETGEVRRPLYVSGLTDATGARHILLASPWMHKGKRAVLYADGSGLVIDAREFEEQLARTLDETGGELVE